MILLRCPYCLAKNHIPAFFISLKMTFVLIFVLRTFSHIKSWIIWEHDITFREYRTTMTTPFPLKLGHELGTAQRLNHPQRCAFSKVRAFSVIWILRSSCFKSQNIVFLFRTPLCPIALKFRGSFTVTVKHITDMH